MHLILFLVLHLYTDFRVFIIQNYSLNNAWEYLADCVPTCEYCASVIACSLAGLCDWSPKSTHFFCCSLCNLPQNLQVACSRKMKIISQSYTVFPPIPTTFAIYLHIPKKINFVCSCVQSIKCERKL